MLYIRADGNAKIGTGHIMRCLSIANTAKALGRFCAFITADKEMEPLLKKQGFPVYCLNSSWDDLSQETQKMKQLIFDKSIKKLLIDSYFITSEYMSELCTLTSVTYMDDINAFHYPCHTLINYNYYENFFNYPINYPDTHLLLGCKYAPLRAEFQSIKPFTVKNQITDILITTGGSDPFNVATKLLKGAACHSEFEKVNFHVIAGRFNSNILDLHTLAKANPRIAVYENIRNISEIMQKCDIAISAGGSTLYELCACGVPTVFFQFADNQKYASLAFGESTMIYAGDMRGSQTECIQAILKGILSLASNIELRQLFSQRMQTLVDGLGAERIAATLLK